MEEALPLALFCNGYYSNIPDVKIRHVVGSHQYDAEASDGRGLPGPLNFLEVTQAHEGYDAILRTRYLNQHDSVSQSGKVDHSGTLRVRQQRLVSFFHILH